MAQRSALKALSPVWQVIGNIQIFHVGIVRRKLIAQIMDHVVRALYYICAATQLLQVTLGKGLTPVKIISRLQRRGKSAIFALFVELGNLARGLDIM